MFATRHIHSPTYQRYLDGAYGLYGDCFGCFEKALEKNDSQLIFVEDPERVVLPQGSYVLFDRGDALVLGPIEDFDNSVYKGFICFTTYEAEVNDDALVVFDCGHGFDDLEDTCVFFCPCCKSHENNHPVCAYMLKNSSGKRNKYYVDQYLCDYKGNPVKTVSNFPFKDHFQGQKEVVIDGNTYCLAWEVERVKSPLATQTATKLRSVTPTGYFDEAPNHIFTGLVTIAKVPKGDLRTTIDYEVFGLGFVANNFETRFLAANCQLNGSFTAIDLFTTCGFVKKYHPCCDKWSAGVYKPCFCDKPNMLGFYDTDIVSPGTPILSECTDRKVGSVATLFGKLIKKVGVVAKVDVWKCVAISCVTTNSDVKDVYGPKDWVKTPLNLLSHTYNAIVDGVDYCVTYPVSENMLCYKEWVKDVCITTLVTPDWVKNLGTQFVELWQTVCDTISGVLEKVSVAVLKIVEQLSDFFSTYIVKLKDGKFIYNLAGGVSGVVKDIVATVFDALNQFVQLCTETATDGFIKFKKIVIGKGFAQIADTLYTEEIYEMSSFVEHLQQHAPDVSVNNAQIVETVKCFREFTTTEDDYRCANNIDCIPARHFHVQNHSYVEPAQEGTIALVTAEGVAKPYFESQNQDGVFYYPITDSGKIVKLCLKKCGGVTFDDNNTVHEVPRDDNKSWVRIKLVYEFDEDDVVNSSFGEACSKVLPSVNVDNDTTYAQFVVLIYKELTPAAEILEERGLTPPDLHIYDEEGVKRIASTMIVSQWPLEDDLEDVAVDPSSEGDCSEEEVCLSDSDDSEEEVECDDDVTINQESSSLNVEESKQTDNTVLDTTLEKENVGDLKQADNTVKNDFPISWAVAVEEQIKNLSNTTTPAGDDKQQDGQIVGISKVVPEKVAELVDDVQLKPQTPVKVILPEMPSFEFKGVVFQAFDLSTSVDMSLAYFKTFDVIVNAANEKLSHGGGFAGFLNKASKGRLQTESNNVKKPFNGRCIVTSHSGLCNKMIIHAVGPRFEEEYYKTKLQQTHKAVVEKLQCKANPGDKILYPILSSGIFGVPLSEALNIMMNTVICAAEKYKITVPCKDVQQLEELKKLLKVQKVKVLVSEGDDNYTTTDVVLTKTFGEQFGSCTIAGVDVSNRYPTHQDNMKAVFKVPVADWNLYYGLPDGEKFEQYRLCFKNNLVPKVIEIDGNKIVCFQQKDNCCWVNAVVNMLQCVKPVFSTNAIADFYAKFLMCDVNDFLAFIYYTSGTKYGEPGDAEFTFSKLMNYTQNQTNSTWQTVCKDCGVHDVKSTDVCVYRKLATEYTEPCNNGFCDKMVCTSLVLCKGNSYVHTLAHHDKFTTDTLFDKVYAPVKMAVSLIGNPDAGHYKTVWFADGSIYIVDADKIIKLRSVDVNMNKVKALSGVLTSVVLGPVDYEVVTPYNTPYASSSEQVDQIETTGTIESADIKQQSDVGVETQVSDVQPLQVATEPVAKEPVKKAPIQPLPREGISDFYTFVADTYVNGKTGQFFATSVSLCGKLYNYIEGVNIYPSLQWCYTYIMKVKQTTVTLFAEESEVRRKTSKCFNFCWTTFFNFICWMGSIKTNVEQSGAMSVVKTSKVVGKNLVKIVVCETVKKIQRLKYIVFWLATACIMMFLLHNTWNWWKLDMNSSFCKEYVKGYYNSSFNRPDYCEETGNVRDCLVCTAEQDSLTNYKHLGFSWKDVSLNKYDFPQFSKTSVLFLLLLVDCNVVVKLYICYSVSVWILNLLTIYGFVTFSATWLLWPFSTTSPVVVVFNLVCYVAKLVLHAIYGCTKPECKVCSRLRKQEKIESSIVVNGSKKLFYVHANGGTSWCYKHNFPCSQCDSFDSGSTFMTPSVASDVSNMFKTTIKPTYPTCFINADQVDFKGGYYFVYYKDPVTGFRSHRKYASDLRRKEHSVAECVKTMSTKEDCIVYNSDVTSYDLGKQVCAYFAQMMSKPIILLDQALLDSFSFNMEEEVVKSKIKLVKDLYSVDKDVNTLDDLYFVIKSKVDTTLDKFKSILDVAYKWKCDLVNDSWNNFLLSYTKLDNVSAVDCAKITSAESSFVSPAVAKNKGLRLVWNSDFCNLSDNAQRYFVNGARNKGVQFCFTLNTTKSTQVVPCEAPKRGGSPTIWFSGLTRWFKSLWVILIVVCVLTASSLFFIQTSSVAYNNVKHPNLELKQSNFKFSMIKDGYVVPLEKDLQCVWSPYKDFNKWYKKYYGGEVTHSRSCPIIVGPRFDDSPTFTRPNTPAPFQYINNNIVFFLEESKLDSGVCYDENGVQHMNLTTSKCIFNSFCTTLVVDKKVDFCADVNTEYVKPYKQLQPHTKYPTLEKDRYIAFPRELLNTLYRVVETKAMTYCKAGICFESKQGYCVGDVDKWIVFDDNTDNFCFGGVKDLVKLFYDTAVSPIDVVLFSGRILVLWFSVIVFVVMVFVFLKFKRVFGDWCLAVFMVIVAAVVNTIMIVFSNNVIVLVVYAIMYKAVSNTLQNSVLLDIVYIIAHCTVTPWWLLVIYVVHTLYRVAPTLFQFNVSKALYCGNEFVGTFDTASMGTFLLDKHAAVKLLNSITPQLLNDYANMYNKYKNMSGSVEQSDYSSACKAALAKALREFQQTGHDVLYMPPTISLTSKLQAGLKKMCNPPGPLEKCVVSVSCGSTLNGLWVGDTVYCPRHVISENLTHVQDYDTLVLTTRPSAFTIVVKNQILTPVSVKMTGTVLQLKVKEINPHTPDNYDFVTFNPGDTFTILLAYNGVVKGLYTVDLRSNNTIKGSFLAGSCGTVGYKTDGTKLLIGYMHHMELPGSVHVGSNLHGVMYGNLKDQPIAQHAGLDVIYTNNVVASLYAALLNGENWFLKAVEPVTVDTYNCWAVDNGYSTFENSVECDMFATKTGVPASILLSAIMKYSSNIGKRTVLGQSCFTDEFKFSDVGEQMLGLKLQSFKKTKTSVAFFLLWVLLSLCTCISFTRFSIFQSMVYDLKKFCLLVCVCVSMFVSLTVKHKWTYLNTFVLPAVCVIIYDNLYFVDNVLGFLTLRQIISVSILDILIGCFSLWVLLNSAFRCVTYSFTHVMVMLYGLYKLVDVIVYGVYDYTAIWLYVVGFSTNNLSVTSLAYKLAMIINSVYLSTDFFATAKTEMLAYMCVGWLCCSYYGIFYWLNRILRLNLGCYTYKVSMAEFRYMVSRGLQAPTNAVEALLLNIKLAGIGGYPSISVGSMQSNLTDVKCCSVVLLGILQKCRVEARSAEWKWCVDMHNQILLETDHDKAVSLLAAMVGYLTSKSANVDLTDLLDEYFKKDSLLQACASTFASMPEFIAYEQANKDLQDAIQRGDSEQVIKHLKKSVNRAKNDLDHAKSVAAKLERMAQEASVNMFKEARAIDRKTKAMSSLHHLLMSMLKKLNMSAIDNVLKLAQNNVVPLNIIPITTSSKLVVVVPDANIFKSLWDDGKIHYAGAVWTVSNILNADDQDVNFVDVRQNSDSMVWPLTLNCTRDTALQNNEITPTKLKVKSVVCESEKGSVNAMALTGNEAGKNWLFAVQSENPTLTVVKHGDVVVELERPARFLVDTPTGQKVMYLYFVKNLNTLRRGAVLGHLGSTLRLQAGKSTEVPENVNILSMCAFSVDPEKTYLDYVKSGQNPLKSCVKMLTDRTGNGMAITPRPEATYNQDSYGGASVCIYCRSYTAHPGYDGVCKLKGKFVQVPKGTVDPVRFVIENEICPVCACWKQFGCTCNRSYQIQGKDESYLNELQGLVALD